MKSEVPIEERPGTQLDHRLTEKVWVRRKGRRVHVGFFDPTQGVYQWGGDLGKHVYWKRRVLALGPEECQAIADRKPQRLEFIDKGRVCYAIRTADARKHGYWYDGESGIGRRFGIPLEKFDTDEFIPQSRLNQERQDRGGLFDEGALDR